MSVKQQIKYALNSLLMPYCYEIIQSSLLYDWQKSSAPFKPNYQKSGLPDGADDYLGPNNPRFSDDKAKAIPLYNIENTLKENHTDIAVNIHSFSECQMPAIDWWLALLERNRVKYLMIVPNAYDGNKGKTLLTGEYGNYQDFSEIIAGHGYKLIAEEPKYRDPIVQEYGINSTHHYLFELV